jgi:acetyl-CoA acetyltransferase
VATVAGVEVAGVEVAGVEVAGVEVAGVEVAGVGMHPFGRHGELSLADMGARAVRAALAEAEVGRDGFQAAFCGTAYGGVATGHKVLGSLGMTGMPIVDVEAGCASGSAALMLGGAAIAAGQYDCVVVFGVEKMPKGIIRSSFFEPWQEEAGLAATPAFFALRARRLMEASGVTKDHLAQVVVKNRRHGVANPHAMFRAEVSAEEVLASRVVCEPLHLWMLCSPNEGAAAVVLRAAKAGGGGRKRSGPTRPVRLAAAVLRSHLPGAVLSESTPLSGLVDDTVPAPTSLAAADAYEAAGVGPEDLDVVECQDTDAARELLSYEELGLCPAGGAAKLLEEGATCLGGRLPVNPSGGLLSKGEPLGASALGQVVELVRQLRGEAAGRQVPGARVALGHTVGRGANAGVVVLTR